MADFLVTVDGKYLNFVHTNDSMSSYNFDHLDFRIVYNDVTGRVRAFGKYTSLYENKSPSIFKGYFPIEEFWGNDKVVNNTNVIINPIDDPRYYRTNSNLSGPGMNSASPTSPTDKIYLVKRWLESAGSGNAYKIKIGVKSFNYPGRMLDYNANIPNDCNETYSSAIIASFPGYNFVEHEIPFANTEAGYYAESVKFKKFKRPNGSVTDLTPDEIDIVENIAFIFEHLFKEDDFVDFIQSNGLEFIFNKHFEIINDLAYSSISETEYHDTFNYEYFSLLRIRLIEFYYWAKGTIYQLLGYTILSRIEMLTRIFGLFDTQTLRHIEYDQKIEILYFLIEDNYWISGRWWPSNSNYKLTEEETIVKLVGSIAREVSLNTLNYADINKFMDLLNNTPIFDENTEYNLFSILYNGINDDVVFGDDGKGARGQFVRQVYLLWLESKYNPNSEANQSILVNYDYTSFNAHWRIDDPNEPQTFDETASPSLINYESESFLLWYKDNFNFPFKGNKIVALVETRKTISEALISALVSTLTPFKLNPLYKYIPYGYYEVFQPISVRSTDPNDTIIRIPVATNIANPCAVNDTNNTNSIPIFYLKYIDDLGDISDFKASFGLILDVVLTFTGIGNITKARHLSKASVLRRYLVGEAVTLAEKQLLMRAIRGVAFATWEIVLGTASILYSLANNNCLAFTDPCNPPAQGTPQYDQFQQCQAIQKWLLALEILTLSGDLLAKRYFRKASRELDQILPPDYFDNLDPIHLEDMPNGADVDDLRPFIQEAGNVDGALDDFIDSLDSTITNRLDSLNLSNERRIEFMNDFENNPDALAAFELDPSLIDDWADIAHLVSHRKNIKFLKAYRRILDDIDLQNHVHLGEAKLFPDPPNPTGATVAGYHNPNQLVSPPPGPGQISFRGNIDYSNPNDIPNSYTQGKIERNMSDMIDDSTGEAWKVFNSNPANHMKVKDKKNVFWPQNYNTQRINEEMALAFSYAENRNIFKIGPPDKFGKSSWTYEGKASDGHTIEILFYGGDMNTGTLVTIYPQYF